MEKGEAEAATDGWKRRPLADLGLRKRVEQALSEAKVTTIGRLSKLMNEHGEWWHREVEGIGKVAREDIKDRFEVYWKAHPEYNKPDVG